MIAIRIAIVLLLASTALQAEEFTVSQISEHGKMYEFVPGSLSRGADVRERAVQFVNDRKAQLGFRYGELRTVDTTYQRLQEWIGDVKVTGSSAIVWPPDKDGAFNLIVYQPSKPADPKALAKAQAFRMAEHEEAIRDYVVAMLERRNPGYGGPQWMTEWGVRGLTPRTAFSLEPKIYKDDPNLYVQVLIHPNNPWLVLSGPPDWTISESAAPGTE